jgi:hypothetical protein
MSLSLSIWRVIKFPRRFSTPSTERIVMSKSFDGTQSCAQTDPEVFFPTDKLHWKEKIALAKAICKNCPMLDVCRDYSASNAGLYGVWAGVWRDGSGYVTPVSTKRKEDLWSSTVTTHLAIGA